MSLRQEQTSFLPTNPEKRIDLTIDILLGKTKCTNGSPRFKDREEVKDILRPMANSQAAVEELVERGELNQNKLNELINSRT